MNLKFLCQICLRIRGETRALDEELGDFLDEICDFDITEKHPRYCAECEYQVRQFCDFRKKCVEAIKILKQWKKTKVVNRKPLNTLHMLLPQTASLCKQESERHIVNEMKTKHHDKPKSAQKHQSQIATESNEHCSTVYIHQNNRNEDKDINYSNYVKKESGDKSTEEIIIKLESLDEAGAQNTEPHEYDALNSIPYAYQEVTVKFENDVVVKDDYKDSVSNKVNVATIKLRSSTRVINDGLVGKKRSHDLKTFQGEHSDTSLNSDADDESIGAGDVKKIKLKKNTHSASTNTDNKTDNKSNVKNKVKRTYRRKTEFCVDTLKQKLSSIFENFKEVKSGDGTVVERDVILNNLDNLSSLTMRNLFNRITSSETEFTPRALDLLATLQKKYESKYDAIFDIEYLNSKEQVMEEFVKRKTYKCYIASPFKCELCNVGFKFAKMLEYHTGMFHDPSAGEFVCDVCQVRMKTKRSLMNHTGKKHRAVFRCKLCPVVTYDRRAMVDHANQHQGVQYVCHKCSAVFKSSSALKSHVMYAHITEHVCAFCARTFVTQHGLDVHRYWKHKDKVLPDDEGVPCDTCNITFISHDIYEQHRRITHRERKARAPKKIKKSTSRVVRQGVVCTLTCPVCQTVGNSGFWLHKHLRAQHPEHQPAAPRHLCDECGKGFRLISFLEQHRNVHTGARPFACDKCPAAFHTAKALNNHAQRHRPPRYPCAECGRRFLSSGNLHTHMRRHIGDRRFKCEMCPSAYVYVGSLREHVRAVHAHQRRVRRVNGPTRTDPPIRND